jgi:hypothetical protein
MEQNVNQEMIDTTDSLEAITVMKGMKNFLFFGLLMAMLVSQAMFWMDRLGRIEKSDCTACSSRGSAAVCPAACNSAAAVTPEGVNPKPEAANSSLISLAAPNVIAEQVEQVVQKADLQTPADPTPVEPPVVVVEPTPLPQESPQATLVEATPGRELEFLSLSCRTARRIVRAVNFVTFMAALLYCLTLLMSLKISLTGKLGGINHIARAFFCSLYVLVFLTPWQCFLPGVLLGAMYLPAEMLCGAWAKADSSMFWKVLLYLRFTGLWLLVMWMVVCAQWRSVKWERAMLRRLGMAR